MGKRASSPNPGSAEEIQNWLQSFVSINDSSTSSSDEKSSNAQCNTRVWVFLIGEETSLNHLTINSLAVEQKAAA